MNAEFWGGCSKKRFPGKKFPKGRSSGGGNLHSEKREGTVRLRNPESGAGDHKRSDKRKGELKGKKSIHVRRLFDSYLKKIQREGKRGKARRVANSKRKGPIVEKARQRNLQILLGLVEITSERGVKSGTRKRQTT